MTSISQLGANRASLAPRSTGPALQVDAAAFDNPRLDKGLVLSLACAEGNTNKDGSQRFLGRSEGCPTGYPAQGHVDPGDGLWNKGRLSYAPARHGLPESTSVAECERRALELVSNRMGDIENKLQQLGLSPANPNYRFVAATLMDSVNQTGDACFQGKHSLWNELPQALRELGQGKDPLQVMTDCRIRSHAKDDGSCGSFNGSWAETRSDQARRVGEIYDCLKLHGGVSPTAGTGTASPPAGTPGTSGQSVFDPKPGVPSNPVLGGAPVSTGLLARGSEGPEVRGLQEKLNQAGAQLETDGRYGPDTEQAVRDFQARNNLPPDGVTGPLTLRALDKAAGVLTRGAEGAAVQQLQEKLNQTGAQPRLDTDGVYGERTQQAVRDFQKRHGLSIDGVAGPETLRKLETAPRAPSTPSTPVTQPPKGTPASSGVSGVLEPIVQQDATSCGLASVAMIANAANQKAGTGARPIDDQDLRRENGGGTGYLPSVLNGHLEGTGFRATDEDWSGGSWDAIEKSLQSGNPVMISTNGEFSPSGYGHYVVLTQMEGNRVQYADPADGQLKWTTQDILDAQPAHTDGRWFSRLVKE